jgi:hypothetical protein
MLIASHSDGRQIEYSEETSQYTAGGQPVTLEEVLGFAGAGELTWSTNELREWARGLVSGTQPVSPLPPAPQPEDEPAKKRGWFARLPLWGKVLFVLVWPVSMWYGVYWMWKDGMYTKNTRIVLTVCAVLLMGFGMSGSRTPSGTPATPGRASSTAAGEPSTQGQTQAEPAPIPAPVKRTATEVATAAFGTFTPIPYSGKGDSVVRLPDGIEAALVTARHKGSSNFAIQTLDDQNGGVELLVNEIGKYSGTTLYSESSPKKLKITANGSWSIQVAPVSSAATMGVTAQGSGDTVLLYDGPAADLSITHKGKSNFAVKMISADDSDLLVNEIGDYSGVVPVSEGPAVVIITADGSWSFAAQ